MIMGWLSFTQKEAEQVPNMQLEELIVHMIRFGRPRVSYVSNGWYCKVEMNTNTKGTQFDIASEFDHPTPLSAARECHQRILSAMKTLTS